MNNTDMFEKKSHIILLLIIVCQLCSLIYIFNFEKKGFFSDDGFDYLFANSNGVRWIGKDQITKFDNWISGEEVRSFIEVEEQRRFDFETALYNMEEDYVPPLYSLVLNAVCSCFPGEFSWWFVLFVR